MALPYNQRTHRNGELRTEHEGQEVLLVGWVHARRDHGGMVFIDIRDTSGLTQLKFNPQTDPKAHEIAQTLRGEDVIAIRGKVGLRGANVNPNLPTGEVEISVRELDVIGKADTPPLDMDDMEAASEDRRLRYRYLDLRRPSVQKVFWLPSLS